MSTQATPTPREQLLTALRRQHGESEGVIAQFATNLAINPRSAFSWGDKAAAAAAKQAVLAEVMAYVEDGGRALLRVAEFAREETVRRAGSIGHRSTSPMHNIVEDATLVAWAEILPTIQFHANREAEVVA